MASTSGEPTQQIREAGSEARHSRAILDPAELGDCNSCGFCQAACPVYAITRHEGDCARGHTTQLRALLAHGTDTESRIASRESSVAEHFADCLTCRACTAHCPAGMQTDRVVVEARQRLAGSPSSGIVGRAHTRLERLVLRSILGDPRALRRGVRLLRVLAHARPDLLLSVVRWLPLLPDGLDIAMSMLPRPRSGFLCERVARGESGLAVGDGTPVSYFMSCGMNYLRPESGEATLRVLRAADYAPTSPAHGCCGLPAYVAGDVAAAAAMARRNVAAFAGGDAPIVTDCASCSSFLKEYPRLIGEEGEAFAARVRDFTEFVHDRESTSAPVSEQATVVVTYHDPCHLSRYQKLRDEPRALLRSLRGVEFREMAEADWCCGGAGTYALKKPRMSRRILDRKMRNVAATGAEVLATACPGCLMQLSYGVRRAGLQIRVAHVSELLAERG